MTLNLRNGLFILLSFVVLGAFASPGFAQEGAGADTVKVFILAGQSNMEGKAPNKLFEHQASDDQTKSHFQHLRDDEGWIKRDDVFIRFLNRKGKLTLGYGSRDRTGVELEFGTVMGNKLDDPVLLIKTAWGGHSLFKLFRSPSAGMPAQAKLEAELEQAIKRTENRNKKNNRNDPLPTMKDITQDYGKSYREMMAQIEDTKSNLGQLFPELKGRKFEISGFVWFQGWNDQYGAEQEYESNMRHFIKDVRKDLGVADLPFVIGVMGQNGATPAKGAMKIIQDAQVKMATLPEFRDNVRAVRTDVLVDEAAEKLYPTWKENFEEWQKTGGDHRYHYLGSAIWFTRIGHEMGNAMLELLDRDN